MHGLGRGLTRSSEQGVRSLAHFRIPIFSLTDCLPGECLEIVRDIRLHKPVLQGRQPIQRAKVLVRNGIAHRVALRLELFRREQGIAQSRMNFKP